jgi:hypothetical protein
MREHGSLLSPQKEIGPAAQVTGPTYDALFAIDTLRDGQRLHSYSKLVSKGLAEPRKFKHF